MTGVAANPRGLDLERLSAWLSTEVPSLRGSAIKAHHLSGGKSNYTYAVEVDGQRFVLRRPPLGDVLPTAHDMGREYRVMSALGATDVPVPRTIALCSDAAVIGAPFFLMEQVDGSAFFRASELSPLGPERARAVSTALIDALVTLHQVDPSSVGLADFGRPDGFVSRQIRRWRAQLDASHTHDLQGLDDLHSALVDRVPDAGPTGIVHGDYKLDNVIIANDEPRAIIDWEMSTLGDTFTDLALLVVYQRLGAQVGGDSVTDSASAPGFLKEDEILDRYSARSGRSLEHLDFYLALGAFKLAGIIQGVHHRHLNGQTQGAGFDDLSDVPELLIATGLTSLKKGL